MNRELSIFLEKGCNAVLFTSRYVMKHSSVWSHHNNHSDFTNCVTNVNHEIEKMLRKGLSSICLPVSVVKHIHMTFRENTKQNKHYWIINPDNKPEELVNQHGEFSITLAFMCDYTRLFSIILVPIEDRLYIESSEGARLVIEKCSELELDISFDSILTVAVPYVESSESSEAISEQEEECKNFNMNYWFG